MIMNDKPNYEFYLRKDLWTAIEAVHLIDDKDPEFYKQEYSHTPTEAGKLFSDPEFGGKPSSSFYSEYDILKGKNKQTLKKVYEYYEILKTRKELLCDSPPIAYLKWALEKRITLPSELVQYVEDKNKESTPLFALYKLALDDEKRMKAATEVVVKLINLYNSDEVFKLFEYLLLYGLDKELVDKIRNKYEFKKPNFNYWLKFENWSLLQSVILVNELDPDKYEEEIVELIDNFGLKSNWKIYDFKSEIFNRIRKQYKLLHQDKSLKDYCKPKNFADLAIKKEIEVPTEILEYFNLKGKRNNVARDKCQAISSLLWSINPDISIQDMIECKELVEFGCDNKKEEEGTKRKWIEKMKPSKYRIRGRNKGGKKKIIIDVKYEEISKE